MTTQKAVTRAEFEELIAVARKAAEDAAAARATQEANSGKIDAMYTALMVAQPGHKEPLINRMGAVVIGIEAGDRAAKSIMRAAQIITALGVILGAVYFWRNGHPPSR